MSELCRRLYRLNPDEWTEEQEEAENVNKLYRGIYSSLSYVGKRNHLLSDAKKLLKKKLTDFDEKDLKKLVQKINIYDPINLAKEKNKNNDYNFINVDFLNQYKESENNHDILDCYYFKTKEGYFIIFVERKKIFKIVHDQEKDNFKLEEFNIDKN